MKKDIALVVGAGDRNGIGAAVAVKAAQEGMHAVLAGRTQSKLDVSVQEIESRGGSASTVLADCTTEQGVADIFAAVDALGGHLRFVVYNTGRNMPAPFLEHTPRIIDDHWQRCVFGGTLVGQQAIRRMRTNPEQNTPKNVENNTIQPHRGTLIYTGASASLRGKPLFAGFSAAKAGIRAMAQSMADEFAPEGIHVASVIVDGIVNGALVRSVSSLAGLLIKQKGEDGALLPDEVAQAYWSIHHRYPSSQIRELDVRPFKESF